MTRPIHASRPRSRGTYSPHAAASITLTLALLLSLLIVAHGARRAAAQSAAPGGPAALSRAVDVIPGTLVKIEMIKIPAGSVEVNDPAKPGSKRTVQVPSIWMAKTELTWDAYDVYAFRLDLTDSQKAKGVDAAARPSMPYGAPDRGFGHQGYPALSMTYHSAQMFCEWLTKKTGKHYRLATEAEWEYACRAGSKEPVQADKSYLDGVAWYRDNADDKTHTCGTKKPNVWGLVDMLGNAAEWTTGLDGQGVTCGGSYLDKAGSISPSAREKYKPDWQAEDAHEPKSKWWLSDATHVGMRIVRDDQIPATKGADK